MSVRFADRFESSYDDDGRNGKEGTYAGLQQFHLEHKHCKHYGLRQKKNVFWGKWKCMNIC